MPALSVINPHKLVVASYINPAASFEITLEKEMDFTRLLNHKRLISLESVEIDQKQITSDGLVMVSDPYSLLKTMVKKIKNMILCGICPGKKEPRAVKGTGVFPWVARALFHQFVLVPEDQRIIESIDKHDTLRMDAATEDFL